MSTTPLRGTPLAGRVAVVSGASSGMGAVTAERLAGLGATVVVLARRADRLDAVVKNIEAAGGTALALAVAVTDRAAVQAAADRVAERYGKADLVFNNAGVQLISGIEDLRVDDWQRQIDLNISGLMNVIAAFVPHLTESSLLKEELQNRGSASHYPDPHRRRGGDVRAGEQLSDPLATSSPISS